MNPIHQCFQNISPGNHFSYVRDVRTDKGDVICPPPPLHYKWRGHKNVQSNLMNSKFSVLEVLFRFINSSKYRSVDIKHITIKMQTEWQKGRLGTGKTGWKEGRKRRQRDRQADGQKSGIWNIRGRQAVWKTDRQ